MKKEYKKKAIKIKRYQNRSKEEKEKKQQYDCESYKKSFRR